MPDRPGLDDFGPLIQLISDWVDGAADIGSRVDRIEQTILSELQDPRVDANRIFRLRLQVRRLEQLRLDAEHVIDDLVQQTRGFINEGGMREVYLAGAKVTELATGIPFQFSPPHRAAVTAFSQDLFDDVLTATRFVDNEAKAYIRRVGRQLTGFEITSGTPVKTQARRLSRDLKRELGRHGLTSIIYRDGSRHSFGEYSEMLLRTKTGIAYNQASLNQGKLVGVTHYEILDGALCGYTAHNDPLLANGLIVTAQQAQDFPLAHPSCRRALNPRPDINAQNAGSAVSVQSEGSRVDQAAFEEALRRQVAERSRRRVRRQRRQRRSRTN